MTVRLSNEERGIVLRTLKALQIHRRLRLVHRRFHAACLGDGRRIGPGRVSGRRNTFAQF